MSGLFGFGADEAQQGYEDARRARRQEFESELMERASKGADREGGAPDEQRQLTAINDAADDLQRQVASDTDSDSATRRQYYGQARDLLGKARRTIYARQGAPLLQHWKKESEQVAEALHSGRAGLAQIDPNRLSPAVSYHTGHDAQELTPQSDAVRAARTVMRAVQTGRYRDAIPALSELYCNELGAYVGQQMHDHSVLSAPPRIVAMHPNPKDPSQSTFAAQFQVTAPDGRAGSFVRPLMVSGDHLSLHPEDAGGKPVLAVNTADFIHHTLGLATTILATQHPEMQAQLARSTARQRRKNRFLLELSARVGSRSGYAPRMRYVFSRDGGHLLERTPGGAISRLVQLPGRGLRAREDAQSLGLAVDTDKPAEDLPPDAAAGLDENHVTTFSNGQRWTRRGGTPMRLA